MKLFVIVLSIVISPRSLCCGSTGFDEHTQGFGKEDELVDNIVKRENQNRMSRIKSTAENADSSGGQEDDESEIGKNFEQNENVIDSDIYDQNDDSESKNKGSSNKMDVRSSDDSGHKSYSDSSTGKISGIKDVESEGSSNIEKVNVSKDGGSISDGTSNKKGVSLYKGSGSNTDRSGNTDGVSGSIESKTKTDDSSKTDTISSQVDESKSKESRSSDDSRSKEDTTSDVKESNNSDKYICFKDGEKFKLGPFVDPQGNCSICECCNSGQFTCRKMECPLPECGKNLQTLSDDGCCTVCKLVCKNVNCSSINCRKRRHAYGSNDCCPQCGCARGTLPPVLPGKFGHWCEDCYCYENGTVRCNRPKCPLERLTCVDVVFTNNCTYTCPNGKTCRRGDDIIKYGQVIEHKEKYCTCPDRMWYTRGFCAQMSPTSKRLAVLQDYMCVAATPKLT